MPWKRPVSWTSAFDFIAALSEDLGATGVSVSVSASAARRDTSKTVAMGPWEPQVSRTEADRDDVSASDVHDPIHDLVVALP